jgi:hypothetical protein
MSITLNRRTRAKNTAKAAFFTVAAPVAKKTKAVTSKARQSYEDKKQHIVQESMSTAFAKKYQRECEQCLHLMGGEFNEETILTCEYHGTLWNYLMYGEVDRHLWLYAAKRGRETGTNPVTGLLNDGVEMRDITVSANLAGQSQQAQEYADKHERSAKPKSTEELESWWDHNIRKLHILDDEEVASDA